MSYIAIELPRGTANALRAKLGPSGETFMDDDPDVEYLVERIEKALMGTEPGPIDESMVRAIADIRLHVAERTAYQQAVKDELPNEAHFEQGLRTGKLQTFAEIDRLLAAVEEGVNERRSMNADRDSVSVYRAADGWRWRRRAANGKIVAESGEGYGDKGHARHMAETRNPGVTIEEEEDARDD